ncbi:MAG: DUF6265 family protein [Chitinophagales bacterium]|nr:DUF6265 family protein [Chitinophagales bacterium]
MASKFLWIALMILFLVACGNKQPELMVSGADKVQIYFYNSNGLMDQPLVDTVIAALPDINEMIAGSKNGDECTPTGVIKYLKGDSLLLSVDFSLQGCDELSFIYHNKLSRKMLSEKGKAFLLKFMPANINDVAWLKGTWQSTDNSGRPVYEVWEDKGQNALKGHSYSVYMGDTMIIEQLELKQKDGVLHYVATVNQQNNQRPIFFAAQPRPNMQSFIFANPQHDFPKLIRYQKETEDSLTAYIGDGMENSFLIGMSRVK